MNAAKRQLILDSREAAKTASLESKLRKGIRFDPPKIKDIAQVCDWIADNPGAKNSQALRAAQEAYYESLGVRYT